MPFTKVCKTCGQGKPVSLFYRDRIRADGTQSYSPDCKACLAVYKRTFWDAGAGDRAGRKAIKVEDALQKSVLPRSCRSCGIVKPPTDFYAKGVLESGATRYRPDCIACTVAATASNPEERERIRAATAAWREADPDRSRKSCRDSRNRHIDERRATSRADRLDPVKRPRILASLKKSVTKHKVKRAAAAKAHRKANEAQYKAYLRRYWKENPDKGREHRDKRRARLIGVGGSGYTPADVRRMWTEQSGLCANPYCRGDLAVVGYSVDHRQPISKGGPNEPANLQLLCSPPRGSGLRNCNSRKRTKTWIQFLRDYAKEEGLPWPPPGMGYLEAAE